MRFVIDAQLPPALARVLTAHGHHAQHVGDVGLLEASDGEIWKFAIEHDAAIVTKDEDFPDMALLRAPAPVVVWVRRGNVRRRALIEWFEPLIDEICDSCSQGDLVIELR